MAAATAVDRLETRFSVTGVQRVLNAYQRLEAANSRLASAQAPVAISRARTPAAVTSTRQQASLTILSIQTSTRALLANESAAERVGGAFGLMAGKGIGTFAVLTAAMVGAERGLSGLREGIETVLDRSQRVAGEILNIQGLTGASLGQSAQAVGLMRVAGMSDMQEIREFLRLGKGVFDPKGQAALGKLGIPANPNQSGLQLFTSILDSLDKMPAGIRKTAIEEDLFGARGVAALQPLLRMHKDLRTQVLQSAAAFDTSGLSGLADFGQRVNFAQLATDLNLIVPAGAKLVQVFTPFLDVSVKILEVWNRLNKATSGGALEVALNTATLGIFGMMEDASRVLDSLFGSSDQQQKQSSAADKFSGAVDQFSNAVSMMQDATGELRRAGAVPSGFGDQDAAALQRASALGAIG